MEKLRAGEDTCRAQKMSGPIICFVIPAQAGIYLLRTEIAASPRPTEQTGLIAMTILTDIFLISIKAGKVNTGEDGGGTDNCCQG